MSNEWMDGMKANTTQLPASPLSAPRSSLPPAQMQAYTASPLQQALTPPAYNFSPPALPSVETIPTPERGPDHHHHHHHHQRPDSSTSNGGPDRGGPPNRLPALDPSARLPDGLRANTTNNIHPPHMSGGANVQIYCAACQGISLLRESYACTECVCGLCQMCVDVLMAGQGARRRCPRCACVGGRFKPFQLDVR